MRRLGGSVLVAVVSGAVGACAGSLAAAAGAWLGGAPAAPHLAYGALVGAATGVTASVASALFVVVAGRHPLASLGAVAAVTAAGAVLGSWAAGARDLAACATVLGVSELVGLGAALLWIVAYRRLNQRLRAAQHALRRARGGPAR
jgi:hypothetical protein